MKILRIDHLVITTADLQRCLDFYVGLLGMEHGMEQGHHSLRFGSCKLSIHTQPAQFKPAALNPQMDSADFCLEVDDLQGLLARISKHGYPVAEGPVTRHGAAGTIQSLYMYDPDGNLVELSQYG